MNIKKLVILCLIISSNTFAGDVGHSIIKEMDHAKKQFEEKDRSPDDVDEEEDKKVYNMENEAVEVEVTPGPGPKY